MSVEEIARTLFENVTTAELDFVMKKIMHRGVPQEKCKEMLNFIYANYDVKGE